MSEEVVEINCFWCNNVIELFILRILVVFGIFLDFKGRIFKVSFVNVEL